MKCAKKLNLHGHTDLEFTKKVIFNRAAEGGRGSRTAFGFFNRAAEGGRGSRIAFGFLNRAAVGWAVS